MSELQHLGLNLILRCAALFDSGSQHRLSSCLQSASMAARTQARSISNVLAAHCANAARLSSPSACRALSQHHVCAAFRRSTFVALQPSVYVVLRASSA